MGTLTLLGIRYALILAFGGATYTIAMLQQHDRYIAFGLGLLVIVFLAYVMPAPGRGSLKI